MYRNPKYLIRFALVWGFSVCVSGVRGQQREWNVQVDASAILAPVDPRFWGSNFLFWIEDDQALVDGKIETALRELPCRILRYPGGTVADNFHWRSNMLDNHAMFPYEEGPEQSDFDEFMSFCGRVGAEPILVVNTQSWFLRGDIEGGAREAAEWVRHCKEKGYKTPYWEIGNETYWHPVMTAREYGKLVKVYAQAMKAVDPSIRVSANGHWDIHFSGVKERIDPSLWDGFRQMYLDVKTPAEYKALNDYRDRVVRRPDTADPDKWWEGVIGECGDVIDMVTVHSYFHNNGIKHLDRKMIELKEFLKAKTGKDYPVCLTEYNCNEKDMALRVAGLAEGIGRFLNAGVSISCFWPLRINGYNNRSMLGTDDKNEQYPYQIFQLFAGELRGNMVECASRNDFYAFAACAPQSLSVVVSGRSLKQPARARVDIGMKPLAESVSTTAYRASEGKNPGLASRRVEAEVSDDGVVCFDVHPAEFVILTVKR